MATTVRCPECQRKNRIPTGAAAKARCGACKAPLMPGQGGASTATEPPGFGFGGQPGPASPWGPAGPGGMGGSSIGGDATGARMRQTRRSARTSSTSGAGPSPTGFGGAGGRPGDPRALLVQRWDELLRLVPPDMGLTAALGQGGQGPADPVSWLSAAAHIPRDDLDQVRQVRNSLAGNRPIPNDVITGALETVERALAVVGRTRLPD